MMTRGALVGLVYNKTLLSDSNNHDRGKAVTLMNTDIDSLGTIARMTHEIWAYFLELIIGMVILASQVGWISPVPLVIIFCKFVFPDLPFVVLICSVVCSQVSRFVAQNIRGRQKDWNAATQNRLSMIGSFLGSIKAIKLLGVSGAIADYVTSLREAEIESARRVRWMMYVYLHLLSLPSTFNV